MQAYLKTFGCKVNSAETESITALLKNHQWEIADSPEQADAIIVNSCTVTASGDQRMLQALRKFRRCNPNAVILLTGCYVQAFPENASSLPEVDILTGTKNRNQIPLLLENFFRNPQKIYAVENFLSGEMFESLPQGMDSFHTRAFLKIQDGCNRFCSYCIIPYARGRCRSRKLSEIQELSRKIVSEQYHEIILCGINLACYGQESGLTIVNAVQAVADSGVERIHLSSLEPDGLTVEVIQQLSEIPQLLPHFHISVQSGCDKILTAMRRHYSSAEYASLLETIRKFFPECAITTDIMVGFPNETEQDFQETLAFVQEMQFAEIHIFRYSPRSGTPAAASSGQIPESVKKDRAEKLSSLAEKLHQQYLYSCIGKTFSVLFERQKTPDFHQGHAENYLPVLVPANADENFRNCIFPVTITGIEQGKLTGVIQFSKCPNSSTNFSSAGKDIS